MSVGSIGRGVCKQEMQLIKRVSCNKLQLGAALWSMVHTTQWSIYMGRHPFGYTRIFLVSGLRTPMRLRSAVQAASGREFPLSGLKLDTIIIKKKKKTECYAVPSGISHVPKTLAGLEVRAGPASAPAGILPAITGISPHHTAI